VPPTTPAEHRAGLCVHRSFASATELCGRISRDNNSTQRVPRPRWWQGALSHTLLLSRGCAHLRLETSLSFSDSPSGPHTYVFCCAVLQVYADVSLDGDAFNIAVRVEGVPQAREAPLQLHWCDHCDQGLGSTLAHRVSDACFSCDAR
jgi:hypothetical protein